MVDFATILMPDMLATSWAAMNDGFVLAEERRRRVVGGPDGGEGVGDLTHTVLSVDGGPATIDRRMEVKADRPIASTDRFAMIWLPGFRIGSPAGMRHRIESSGPFLHWLRARHDEGSLIAASGAANMLLLAMGLCREIAVPFAPALVSVARELFPWGKIDVSSSIRQSERLMLSRGPAHDWELVTLALSRVLSPETGHWLRGVSGAVSPEWAEFEPDSLVAAARLRLEQSYTQDVSIADLASNLAVSHAVLIRRFRAEMGVTPSAYRRDLRIAAAKRMLGRSRRSVEEIAATLGYTDARIFRQAFRRSTGMSASDWRSRDQAMR